MAKRRATSTGILDLDDLEKKIEKILARNCCGWYVLLQWFNYPPEPGSFYFSDVVKGKKNAERAALELGRDEFVADEVCGEWLEAYQFAEFLPFAENGDHSERLRVYIVKNLKDERESVVAIPLSMLISAAVDNFFEDES
jgi:hypothetical protein